ncbi:hypothetical protein CPC08DRAFT_101955 [Agrocybe pediades]|nr:hypothetical protein CPC08DRAFT_101955 [Agrocybe pediades]
MNGMLTNGKLEGEKDTRQLKKDVQYTKWSLRERWPCMKYASIASCSACSPCLGRSGYLDGGNRSLVYPEVVQFFLSPFSHMNRSWKWVSKSTIAPGNYFLRNEIIAPPYLGCAERKVGGSHPVILHQGLHRHPNSVQRYQHPYFWQERNDPCHQFPPSQHLQGRYSYQYICMG